MRLCLMCNKTLYWFMQLKTMVIKCVCMTVNTSFLMVSVSSNREKAYVHTRE